MSELQRKMQAVVGVIIFFVGLPVGIIVAIWAPEYFSFDQWVEDSHIFFARIAIVLLTTLVFAVVGATMNALTWVVTLKDRKDDRRS